MKKTDFQRSTPFISSLAGHARVWVFQSSQILSADSQAQISEKLDEFIVKWAAHGSDLYAGFDIRYDRFIAIAVDENRAPATGCSIDSMMKVIQQIDQHYQLDLLNRMKVAYRSGEEVLEADVNTFSQMLANREVNENTIVFNNIIQTIDELNSKWEVPVGDSWCQNLLP